MMATPPTPRAVQNLMNALAESVANMTDEEIIQEAIENGIDVPQEAERVRQVLLRGVGRQEGKVAKRTSGDDTEIRCGGCDTVLAGGPPDEGEST